MREAVQSPDTGNRVEVAAGLLFRNARLLITQRRHGDHLGGLWEFPGGKRRSDESFEACLQRELREELGIEIEVKELLETVVHRYAEKEVLLQFYRCILRAHEPQPLGCQALAWVQAQELSGYEFPGADARLLEKLRQSPELWDGRC